MKIGFTFDKGQVETILQALEEIPRKARRALKDMASILLDEVTISASSLMKSAELGWPKRGRRSLASSFKIVAKSENEIAVESQLPYAGVHEDAGKIRSGGRLMKVPILDITSPKGAFGKTFVLPKQKGKDYYVVMYRPSPRATPYPIYLLKREITIPRSYYLTKALDKVEPRIEKELEKLGDLLG